MISTCTCPFAKAEFSIGYTDAVVQDQITCALIPDRMLGFAESATFQLLEVELSNKPNLVLLERVEIEKILEEKMLQLAFSAGGGETRRQLGDLLKARMLVIIRASEKQVGENKNIQSLRIVVADTSTGLRILTGTLIWDKSKPDETARKIVEDVLRARAKMAEAIRAIIAVPLFVSEDFTFHYASYKHIYSELLRQGLENMKGVHVIEIDEAQAIADELTLTGGESVHRLLQPYFILGRYRNNDEGIERRVQITLQLKQGEHVLSEKTSGELAPNSVADYLRTTVIAFLKEIFNTQVPTFNTARDVDQFKRRAGDYEELEEYEEAFHLIQAAVLVQPEPSLYEYGIQLCAKMINSAHEERGGSDDFEARAWKAAAANLVGLDYVEHLLRTRGLTGNTKSFRSLVRCGYGIYNPLQYTHNWELRRMIESVGLKKREILLSFLESLLAANKLTPATFNTGLFVQSICFPMPGGFKIRETYAEHLAAKFRLVRVLNAVPGMSGRICWAISYEKGQSQRSHTDVQAINNFLDRVANLPGIEPKVIAAYFRMLETTKESEQKLSKLDSLIHYVQSSVGIKDDNSILRYLKQERRRIDGSAFKKLTLPKESPVAEIQYRYIEELTEAFPDFRDDGEKKFSFLAHNVGGVFACNDGIDLYWVCQRDNGMRPPRIFAMRTKGKLEHLYTANKLHTKSRVHIPITSMIYDGKYVWAAQKELLLIIDPKNGLVDTVSHDDGLLPGTMKVAPVAPGSVCVIGYFGRTWCANVCYSEAGDKSVEVFHKAALPKGDALNPQVVFEPKVMVSLYDSSKPDCRVVLVIRKKSQSGYPLLIDPVKRTVQVLPISINLIDRHSYTMHEGAFYWCDQPESYIPFKMRLCRLATPGFHKEVIIDDHEYKGSDLVTPLIFFEKNQCFITGRFNYMVDLETGVLSPVAGKRNPHFHPWYRTDDRLFVNTNHYGLVYLGWWDYRQPFMQVLFDEPPTLIEKRVLSGSQDVASTKPASTDKPGSGAGTTIVSTEEPPDEIKKADIGLSLAEAEIVRAAKLSKHPVKETIPDNPNTRTIGGQFHVKEYYHIFAFEDENGNLLDALKAGIQYMDVPHGHLKRDEIQQGGYFPLGTFEVINPSPKYEPITITPASPERLIFRLKNRAGNEAVNE